MNEFSDPLTENSETQGTNVRNFYTPRNGEKRSKGETCKGQLLVRSRDQQMGGEGGKIRGGRAVVRFTCR